MSAGIISDYACELGEGPTYDPDTGTLYWFDILGKKLLEKRMPDGDVVIHDLPVMASALAVIGPEKQLLVTENGLYVRDVPSGALTLHVEVEANNALTRSNDARVHPSGSLWFSMMAKQNASKSPIGSIYWYREGAVEQLWTGICIPNSICFSPDGSVGYFVDTANNRLMRVPCDPKSGLPAGQPAVFVDGGKGPGDIDGSVCDANGAIWNARWGGGRVDVYSPDGELIRSVDAPARQASCPVFYGRHAAYLGCTSALEGMSASERAADPQAGMTFQLDVEVKGRFEPKVIL